MSEEIWTPIFDLSIQAFWTGRHEDGRLACEWLLSRADLPAEIEALTRQNQVFYSRGLADLAASTQFVDIAIDVQPGWSCFNPSIAAADGAWRMIVRSSNYRLHEGGYETVDGGPVRTESFLAGLAPDLSIESVEPIGDLVGPPLRTGFPVEGFEDCRLVRWNDAWHATATARDLNVAGICQQVLLRIGEDGFDRLWPLSNPAAGYHEKNWMPLDLDGNLLLVYSVSPMIVVRFDPESEGVQVVKEAPAPAILRSARGGSQLARFGEGWLAVIHESIPFDDGTRSYPHRFVWFNSSLDPVFLSEQFHFLQQGVEYCAGLAFQDGMLVASFGSGDTTAHLAILDPNELAGMLAPPIDIDAFDSAPLLAAAAEVARLAAESEDADDETENAPESGAEPEYAAESTPVSMPATESRLTAPSPAQDAAEAVSEIQFAPGGPAGDDDGITTAPPISMIEATTNANENVHAVAFEAIGRPVRIVSTTISGNNAGMIAEALESVVDWVDACLLIDTGITDDTIDVARSVAGDKLIVQSFPWNNSFSDARNFALHAAAQTGADWSVTLDTDERLVIDPSSLREFLSSTKAGLLHLRFEDGSYGKERFFRLPVRGEFVGPTHEAFVGDVLVLDVPDGHFEEEGKDEDALQVKFQRDISILSRHIVDNPEDPRWHYYLGDALQNSGRLREAVEEFRACWALNGWDEESAWAMYRAAECQIALGELDAAIQSCADGLVRHPGIAELPWLASWACYRKGEMRRAIAWARMSCAIGSVEGIGDSFHRLGFTNPRGRFEGPYDVLRFALRELGEDEAADAAEYLFDEALAMRGSSREEQLG